MFGGGDKKETDIVSKVLSMRQQGMTNDQIVSSMQQQGQQIDKIFEAIHMADMKGSVQQGQTQMHEQAPQEGPSMVPSQDQQFSQQGANSSISSAGGSAVAGSQKEQIEQIAEAIIDEKWNILVESINKLIDWKETVEEDIKQLQVKSDTIKEDMKNIQNAIMGKLSNYDKNMTDVGTDVKALTSVFQKILPGFIDNVHELSRITTRLGGKAHNPSASSIGQGSQSNASGAAASKSAAIFDDNEIPSAGKKQEENSGSSSDDEDDKSIEHMF